MNCAFVLALNHSKVRGEDHPPTFCLDGFSWTQAGPSGIRGQRPSPTERSSRWQDLAVYASYPQNAAAQHEGQKRGEKPTGELNKPHQRVFLVCRARRGVKQGRGHSSPAEELGAHATPCLQNERQDHWQMGTPVPGQSAHLQPQHKAAAYGIPGVFAGPQGSIPAPGRLLQNERADYNGKLSVPHLTRELGVSPCLPGSSLGTLLPPGHI